MKKSFLLIILIALVLIPIKKGYAAIIGTNVLPGELTVTFGGGGTTYTTSGTITPVAGRLYLATINTYSPVKVPTSVTGAGLTWVLVTSSAGTNSVQQFVYRAMGTGTNGAITVTLPSSTTILGITIDEFQNVDTSGTNGSGAIVQSNAAQSSISGTTQSVSLSAFADPVNDVAFGGSVAIAGGGVTAGSGFTLLNTSTNFGYSQGTEYKVGEDTLVDTTSASSNWAIVGIEIKVAPSASVSPVRFFLGRQMIIGVPGVGSGSGFGQYRTITVDHTKVPSNRTNFPVLVNGVYSSLATVANGGKVTDAQGDDIGFYSSPTCSTGKLDWETVFWSSTTGTVEYWVEIPSLSSSVDTVFYLCYGNSSITTDQSNKTGTWDSNFGGVWHLPDGTTLTANDSTSNANNLGTISGATAIAGKIDGAANFATTQYLGLGTGGTNLSASAQKNITLSAWVRKTTGTSQVIIIGSRKGGNGYMMNINTDRSLHLLKASVADTSVAAASPNDTLWHYYSVQSDASGEQFYVDGASVGTAANTSNYSSNGTDFRIGFDSEDVLSSAGAIDDVRVSATTNRGADWQLTEYNSVATSTFYTLGSETLLTSATPGTGQLIIR